MTNVHGDMDNENWSILSFPSRTVLILNLEQGVISLSQTGPLSTLAQRFRLSIL